jgi:signal transduction histidine kinase
MTASWANPAKMAAGTEERLGQFTALAGTAIANAESRAELATSRARIVLAADQARRRIQRDLHDGAQQRLVSLALDIRVAEGMVGSDQDDLVAILERAGNAAELAIQELQELSRGLHPAVLTKGGLRPALGALVRSCPVPVRLALGVDGRLPEPVEIAAYYTVSEAVTNIAKHAEATNVDVRAATEGDHLVLTIIDDGRGGADPGGGSGLIGLRDRVEALGGTLTVASRPGTGTRLDVRLPMADGHDGEEHAACGGCSTLRYR